MRTEKRRYRACALKVYCACIKNQNPYLLAISVVKTYTTLGLWALLGSLEALWPPIALWEGVEERLRAGLEAGWELGSWGFKSPEEQSRRQTEEKADKFCELSGTKKITL